MIKLVWQEGARWRKRFFFTRDGALKNSRRFSATNYFDIAVVSSLLIGASLTRLYLVFLDHKILFLTFDLGEYDRKLKKNSNMYGPARVRGVVCVIYPDEIQVISGRADEQ